MTVIPNDERRPGEPSTDLVREVLAALRATCRGDITEFKVVFTRRGVDVLRTDKRRFVEGR